MSNSEEKIYCANCSNCKIVADTAAVEGQIFLRVRCAAGKWKKKTGTEKLRKYFTIARCSIPFCDSYDCMGDEPELFIKELKKSLPTSDESYDRWVNSDLY